MRRPKNVFVILREAKDLCTRPAASTLSAGCPDPSIRNTRGPQDDKTLWAATMTLYSTFHPLTSTAALLVPNSLARYVAVTSRFSPGSNEM